MSLITTKNELGRKRFDAVFSYIDCTGIETESLQVDTLYFGTPGKVGTFKMRESGDAGLANSLLVEQCTVAKTTEADNGTYEILHVFTQ